jgi:hypothetical protein
MKSYVTNYNTGVEGIELNWFQNYLTNRTQYVDFGGNPITTGSILGPLLFTIYMNDICFASNFNSILFADDTTLETPIS